MESYRVSIRSPKNHCCDVSGQAPGRQAAPVAQNHSVQASNLRKSPRSRGSAKLSKHCRGGNTRLVTLQPCGTSRNALNARPVGVGRSRRAVPEGPRPTRRDRSTLRWTLQTLPDGVAWCRSRRSGGTGRRAGLKIRWEQSLGGSSPPSGITVEGSSQANACSMSPAATASPPSGITVEGSSQANACSMSPAATASPPPASRLRVVRRLTPAQCRLRRQRVPPPASRLSEDTQTYGTREAPGFDAGGFLLMPSALERDPARSGRLSPAFSSRLPLT